jgi:hypothetical protein
MPQPSVNQVHINRVLTNISVRYMQQAEMFVARRVFPVIPVARKSDLYYTFSKNDWFRDEAQRRPPGTPSAGGGYGLATDSYACDVWAFHADVDHQTLANADAPLNLERQATELVSQRMLIRQERDWADKFFTTGVWATDVTPANLWSDYVASDPFGDIETGRRTILLNTGMLPNTLVLGYDVFVRLKQHPDIVDRIKYTGRDVVTPQLLAGLWELDRVLVAQAVVATNVEGETPAYALVHGKHALLCYSEPAPGLLKPSAGYCFAWEGVGGYPGETVAVSSFYIQELKVWRYEAEMAFDHKVVAPDLGYLLANVVA